MILQQSTPDMTIELEVRQLGTDYAVTISGGAAHVGCVVLSVPRPSLLDSSRISCTSSVLNCTGHKDEEVCRLVAETLCIHFKATVVCTGGIHLDNISKRQLEQIFEAVNYLLRQMTQ
ncbi:MAG: hypothetical protein H6Q60_229 [Oscillospiraceae bacterium]|nr:hypothetical protein [Oscillospiraceae bacterium]